MLSGLVLELTKVVYVPAIAKNIIFVSFLCKEGYCFSLINDCCLICRNGIYYDSCKIVNSLYLLDNTRSIYNIQNHNNNKIIKASSQSTYM